MLRFRWITFDRFKVVNLSRFYRVNFIRPYWVNFTVFSNLRMVTVVCFKDNTEVRKPFEVQGDTIKSEQGWKLWKQGEVLLIKDIIEYYLE